LIGWQTKEKNMKRLRSIGLCLVAVVAVSGLAAVSASAEAPEIGRCVKVAPGSGHFATAKCTSHKTGGEFEWLPGAEKTKFTGVGGVGTLETVLKLRVTCKTEASSGEFTSPKTAGNILVTFKGCESGGFKCSTSGAALGEIKTNTLAGTIVWENKPKHKTALDLVPASTELFVEFNCGPLNAKVKGSVLTNVKAGEMKTVIPLKFTDVEGRQKPEFYETASGEKVKDVLLSKLGEREFEQAGQKITNTQTDEEALEVNYFV
jgi:hypothetical protein